MSASEIKSLQNTLNEALDAFRAETAAQNLPEPSLNTSRPHPMDDMTYLPSPAMYEARRAALACLGLLTAMLRPPYEAIAASAFSALEPASLRLAAILDLATIIGDSEDGVGLAELSEKTGVDELKLGRVFSCLLTQGWFREPSVNHFANNRMSNIIRRDQPGFHMATHMNQLFGKIGLFFPEMISHPDPDFRKSTDASHTAFQLAHNTDLPYFGANSWCSNQPLEAMKFARAMGGIGPVTNPGVAVDFPWVDVCRGKDAVVDVGGGQGTLCCYLAEKYPEIKQFIVQDLIDLKEVAEANIKSKGLADRVSFEVQNFLTPQKRKGKYVFVLQRVLHDWSMETAVSILRNIRDVLNLDSTIVIIETLIQPGVTSSTGPSLKESLSKLDRNVYTMIPPPPFVPENFSDANRVPHTVSAGLTALCNGFERTLPQLEETVAMAGLKIKRVYPTRGRASVTEVGLP